MTWPGKQRKYRGEDEVDKVKIDATKRLENYRITARNVCTEEKIKFKFEAGHAEKVVPNASDRVDKNQMAGKDEFEATEEKLQQHEHDVARGSWQVASIKQCKKKKEEKEEKERRQEEKERRGAEIEEGRSEEEMEGEEDGEEEHGADEWRRKDEKGER